MVSVSCPAPSLTVPFGKGQQSSPERQQIEEMRAEREAWTIRMQQLEAPKIMPMPPRVP
ncbi:MAG: hypothetical protein F6K11_10560 [Leptolyngbya sp. SIO3F4]|nr:hypothetical protein [Leptolyngbya sp. SIO3F4]